MNFCDYIDFLADVDVKCQAIQGYEQVGYLFNRGDIDFSTIAYGTGDTPSTVVTNLTLKSGKKGVKINQLKKAFAETTVSLATGDYRNGFTQQVSFNIFDHSPKVAKLVNALANGEYVIILEQKDKGENGINTYRVFGLDNGLVASAIDQDNYNESIGNGWTIQLQEENASGSEYFFFKDDIATTKTAISSLVD